MIGNVLGLKERGFFRNQRGFLLVQNRRCGYGKIIGSKCKQLRLAIDHIRPCLRRIESCPNGVKNG